MLVSGMSAVKCSRWFPNSAKVSVDSSHGAGAATAGSFLSQGWRVAGRRGPTSAFETFYYQFWDDLKTKKKLKLENVENDFT